MIAELTKALTRAGLAVEEVAGSLNVKHGSGPLAHAVNLDPGPVVEWLGSRGPATRRRDVASWANGVATTLLEPIRSDARTWSFIEAAGSLFPTIEGAGYALGVEAASGERPWLRPLDESGELFVAWVLRLGRGMRPLTAPHVAEMGVTDDRIAAAARSLLFHATRNHHFRDAGVLELTVGDGHDAARLLVVADVFFAEVDESWGFAIPHPDALLAARAHAIDTLRAEAGARFAEAAYPLDERVWRLTAAGPQPES